MSKRFFLTDGLVAALFIWTSLPAQAANEALCQRKSSDYYNHCMSDPNVAVDIDGTHGYQNASACQGGKDRFFRHCLQEQKAEDDKKARDDQANAGPSLRERLREQMIESSNRATREREEALRPAGSRKKILSRTVNGTEYKLIYNDPRNPPVCEVRERNSGHSEYLQPNQCPVEDFCTFYSELSGGQSLDLLPERCKSQPRRAALPVPAPAAPVTSQEATAPTPEPQKSYRDQILENALPNFQVSIPPLPRPVGALPPLRAAAPANIPGRPAPPQSASTLTGLGGSDTAAPHANSTMPATTSPSVQQATAPQPAPEFHSSPGVRPLPGSPPLMDRPEQPMGPPIPGAQAAAGEGPRGVRLDVKPKGHDGDLTDIRKKALQMVRPGS